MVSDSDLVTRLREILRTSDLDMATPASVRRQLEADFGVDLSARKAFIRDQIDAFLENNEQGDHDNVNTEVEGSDAVEAEEEKEEDEGGGSEGDEGSKEGSKKVKKRRGGFTKLCRLSPQLEKFLGASEMARTEVVKKIWAYIKEKSLQDPKNKRNIKCDESLHALFRVKTIDMFQMNKALSKHIWPLTQGDGSVDNMKEEEEKMEDVELEEEQREEEEESNGEEEIGEEEKEAEQSNKVRSKRTKSGKESKGVRKRGGGFTKLCSLSPELQAFLGVSKSARTEVVKMLWSYIKENHLQDPKNKRNIICDESLRSIFHVDSIDMFRMNTALSKHIWPLEDGEGSVKSMKEEEEEEERVEEERKEEEKEDEEREEEGKGEEEKGEEEEEKEEEVGSNGEDEEAEESSNQRSKKSKSGKENNNVKKRGGGFTKLCRLSPELQEITGVPELARTEVVKKLWSYIKEKSLQDPNNKRKIICDESLRTMFCVDSIDMFQMNKALTKHIWPLEDREGNLEDSPEKGKRKLAKEEADSKDQIKKDKRQKKFPLPLSDAL